MNLPDNCPNCGETWIDEPIPEKHRHHYAGTHFRRCIAIYDRKLDCTIAWDCPDCHHRIHRPQAEIDRVKDPRA